MKRIRNIIMVTCLVLQVMVAVVFGFAADGVSKYCLFRLLVPVRRYYFTVVRKKKDNLNG